MSEMPWQSLRAISRVMLKRSAALQVEGLQNVPASGPVILAARHYHHQIDGAALLATLLRPAHLMVALDWAGKGPCKAGLTAACRAARWPAVIRADSPFAVDVKEQRRVLRIAMRDSLQLLREGRILVVFPVGYPNIDANPTPKNADRPFLPFKDGFVRLAAMARAEGIAAPIVPVGFAYEPGPKWRVAMRFGAPVLIGNHGEIERVRAQIEADVIALSRDIASRD